MCTIALKQDTTGDGRCIKPNPESQPGSLTPNYVLEQLRAGGVLEAVRIACAGFPTRKAFRPFAMRYNILLASGRGAYRHLDPETLQEGEAADISRKVLQAVKIMGWQMGKTRVFLRAGQLAQLEVGTRLASCVSCYRYPFTMHVLHAQKAYAWAATHCAAMDETVMAQPWSCQDVVKWMFADWQSRKFTRSGTDS